LKRALCIGISRFQDSTISPLAGGTNDALLLASILQRHYGFRTADVRLLADESATKSAIVAGLEWLVSGAAPGDVLVFTLATHGTRNIDREAPAGPSGEVGGNERIFLTYDSSVANKLLRDEVGSILNRLPPAAHCYCIIDTCDIGPFYYATRIDAVDEARHAARSEANSQFPLDANAQPRSESISRDTTPPRVEMTACADHEQSFDLPIEAGCNGLFTHALYQTLEQHGWDVTVGAAYEDVRSRVSNLAESLKVKQTPQLRCSLRLMSNKIFG